MGSELGRQRCASEKSNIQSPSHTVGSERYGTEAGTIGLLSLHPTRWARNKPILMTQRIITPDVTIPHGGLGTLVNHMACFSGEKSPSHTVGSELQRRVPKGARHHWSPSHTVGSEHLDPQTLQYIIARHHPTRWARNRLPQEA